MVNLAAYLGVCAALVAAFSSLFAGLEWAATGRAPRLVSRLSARLRRVLPAALRPQPSRPEPMPVALLGLELSRLGGEVRRIADSDLPAKAMRLRACTAAYDYVLLECCRSLEVPVPASATPLSTAQRFRVETSLLAAGFSW
jgi:hypothetical protein